MGFGDFFKKVTGGVQRIGEKVAEAPRRIGSVVNKVARLGQDLMNKGENIASQVASLPVIGPAIKAAYENSPLKKIYETTKEQVDSAERISGKLKEGDYNDAMKEAMKNPLIKQQVQKAENQLGGMIPAPFQPYFESARKKFDSEFMS